MKDWEDIEQYQCKCAWCGSFFLGHKRRIVCKECSLLCKHKRCCCNCISRLKDYSHPCTDGKSCTEFKGYICNPGGSDIYYSNWTEHGCCELHLYAREK